MARLGGVEFFASDYGKPTSCKWCGADGIRWGKVRSAWLNPDGTPHRCAEKRAYYSDLAKVNGKIRRAKLAGMMDL